MNPIIFYSTSTTDGWEYYYSTNGKCYKRRINDLEKLEEIKNPQAI